MHAMSQISHHICPHSLLLQHSCLKSQVAKGRLPKACTTLSMTESRSSVNNTVMQQTMWNRAASCALSCCSAGAPAGSSKVGCRSLPMLVALFALHLPESLQSLHRVGASCHSTPHGSCAGSLLRSLESLCFHMSSGLWRSAQRETQAG